MSRPPPARPFLALAPTSGESLDPNDPQALISLWTVLSKGGENIQNGRRLENMSWRIWNREVLYRAGDPSVPLKDGSVNDGSNQSLSSALSDASSSAAPPKLSASSTESINEVGPVHNTRSSLSTASSHPHILSPSSTGEGPPRRPFHPRRLSSQQISQLYELFNTPNDLALYKQRHFGIQIDDLQDSIETPKVKARLSPQPDPPRNTPPNNVVGQGPVARPIDSKNGSKSTSPSGSATSRGLEPTPETTSSASAARPSLFSRPAPQPRVKETTREIPSDYYSDDDTDEDESDSGSDRLGYHQRIGTSTSIVRGFSPSNVSVSFHTRSPRLAPKSESPKSESPKREDEENNDNDQRTTSQGSSWKLTKARSSKMPREKMFFIESSPSDSEGFGGESLSSTDGSGNHGHHKGKNLAAASSAAPIGKSNLQQEHSAGLTEGKLSNSRQSLFAAPTVKSASNLSSKLRLQHQLTSSPGIDKSPFHHSHEEAVVDEEEDDEEDIDGDSAWDSVDDESDSSFDERSFFVRDEEPKKPLTRPSLLSSLFLNNPKLLQRQLEEQRQLQRQQKSRHHSRPETEQLQEEEVVRSKNPTSGLLRAQVAAHIPPPAAMSPRTTRRNMLATELSESVRKNLLWERQQGLPAIPTASNDSSIAPSSNVSPTTSSKAVLKKSHTSTGVPQLKHLSNLSHSLGATSSNVGPSVESWKEELDDNNMDFNYHARGW
jgi:hypothetical protein